jgi:hypothetical protein
VAISVQRGVTYWHPRIFHSSLNRLCADLTKDIGNDERLLRDLLDGGKGKMKRKP